ncbi:MAG: alpha/beta fold hydrolase [Nevskiales bacterium]
MQQSRSEFIDVRGLRAHLRIWGRAGAPRVFVLHGWLDVSGTFQFLVDELLKHGDWEVVAPDFRGFGLSEWPQDGYWFPDYYADFEVMLNHYLPEGAATVIGHSMGAHIASAYAGLRPARTGRLVLLDGLNMPDMPADTAPKRIRVWLDQLGKPPRLRSYESYETLAERIRKHHPKLTPERALAVAHCWGQSGENGRIALCADPKHELRNPLLYRAAEAHAIWREVTADTLFIDGADSPFGKMLDAKETELRRNCFRQHRQSVVPDCGHMMHFEQPEATAQQIAQFLNAG